MPSERASALYRALLADIAGYLSDMEVPQKYIELVSDTASTDIKWVSDEEAKAMKRDAVDCGVAGGDLRCEVPDRGRQTAI